MGAALGPVTRVKRGHRDASHPSAAMAQPTPCVVTRAHRRGEHARRVRPRRWANARSASDEARRTPCIERTPQHVGRRSAVRRGSCWITAQVGRDRSLHQSGPGQMQTRAHVHSAARSRTPLASPRPLWSLPNAAIDTYRRCHASTRRGVPGAGAERRPRRSRARVGRPGRHVSHRGGPCGHAGRR